MEDLNTAKKITRIISSIAVSCALSALFTLSTFSYISDFKYFPQYYNISRYLALLSTTLYAYSLISFIGMCINNVKWFISSPEAKRSAIVNCVKSGWVKTCRNEPISPAERLFSGFVGYSLVRMLSGLLVLALPAITAFALPSILSLDRNLIITSLSVISAVAVFASAVDHCCKIKLLMLLERPKKPHVPSQEKPLNDAVDSDKPLDNAYLVGTEAFQSVGSGKDSDKLLDNACLVDTEVSQSVGSGKIAATFT